MGFIESLLGSGLANAIALHSVSGALKEESANAKSANDSGFNDYQRTGIQKELFERAEKAIKGKQYDVALPLLIRALKLDPYYLYYYSALGVCYQNQGKVDIALECHDKALDIADKVFVKEDIWRWRIRNTPPYKEPDLTKYPEMMGKFRDHDKYIKFVRDSAEKCEKELEKQRPQKVGVPANREEIGPNVESTNGRVRASPKRNARKSNNRGG